MPSLVYPEWLERNDQPLTDTPWSVSPGTPIRGEAWTDIRNRRMRIPTGDDDASRVIRAHELVHAKISPECGPVIPDVYGTLNFPDAERLVTACEEARVNHTVGRARFDLKHLVDGSEKNSGYRAAMSGQPNIITLDLIAQYGTGAVNPYISGIRKAVREGKASKSLLDHANNVKKHIKMYTKHWDSHDSALTSTHPQNTSVRGEDIAVPIGYLYTLELAVRLARLMVREDREPVPGVPDSVETGSDPGKFATPIIKKLPLTERVAGRMNRKRVATNMGTNPRRMHRLLTDPERRVFDRRASDIGGIVLIDQSGSMHLSDGDLWDVIKASPGCVVIGYSHAAGSVDVPNIWVMAERGRVASEVPIGNGGNGVDGPALLYALSKRKGDEPFIWVCDGYVTDSHDNCRASLNEMCIKIVQQNNIHMVPDVGGAIDALGQVSRGRRLKTRLTGPLEQRAQRRGE